MQLVILTQKHVLQKDKYLWIEMFDMNDIMVKESKQQVEQPVMTCSVVTFGVIRV
jgi:hypothetical protein